MSASELRDDRQAEATEVLIKGEARYVIEQGGYHDKGDSAASSKRRRAERDSRRTVRESEVPVSWAARGRRRARNIGRFRV